MSMRLICTSDQHYPVNCPVVENAVLKFAQHVKPTHWVLNGDLFDFFSVSRYDKEPDRRESLQDEFDSARPFLREVCKLANEVHYIPGNHEERLGRLMCDVPGLYGLRALNLPRMAEFPDKIKCHGSSDIITIGKVGVMHGHQVKSSSNPAGWILSNMPGMSYICGHFHRSITQYRTARDPDGGTRTFVAAAQGHGCDERKAKYDPSCPNQNWAKGLTFVEFFTVAGKNRYSLHPLVMVQGRFSYAGKVFDGTKL